ASGSPLAAAIVSSSGRSGTSVNASDVLDPAKKLSESEKICGIAVADIAATVTRATTAAAPLIQRDFTIIPHSVASPVIMLVLCYFDHSQRLYLHSCHNCNT